MVFVAAEQKKPLLLRTGKTCQSHPLCLGKSCNLWSDWFRFGGRALDQCVEMGGISDRKQRLAAALRENLHRRKQQQRARRKTSDFLPEKSQITGVSAEQDSADLSGNDPIHAVDPSLRDENRTD